MYTTIRTAVAKTTTLPEAYEFGKKITKYINNTYNHKMTFSTRVFDNTTELAWTATYNTLADYETFRTKIEADMEYWGLVKNGGNYFVDGSFQDNLWKTFDLD